MHSKVSLILVCAGSAHTNRFSLGYDCLVLERQAYLRILYENIIEKTKVLTGRRVIDVCETPDGVRVHLEGGRWEHGDIVVGCDGVHSIVRTMMWKHAKVTVPGLISTPEKMGEPSVPFKTRNMIAS